MHPKFITRISIVIVTLICLSASVVLFQYRWHHKVPAAVSREGINPRKNVSATPETSLTLEDEAAIEHLKQQGTFTSLAAAVTSATYSINRVSRATSRRDKGSYEAVNANQALHAIFTGDGMHVQSSGQQNWEMGLRLKGYGYGAQIRRVAAGVLKAQDNRIEISRHAAGERQSSSLSEWYLNTPDGLEQGFTLSAPPVMNSRKQARTSGRLRLTMALTGGLRGVAAEDAQSVSLQDSDGRLVARYDHLKAWDATGRELTARMQLSRHEVSVEVDDAAATYPVTIDPLLWQQQAQLTAETDGVAFDNFGWSVAISGDTAIVGAREFHGSGAHRNGSAYIFVRNGAEWSRRARLVAADGVADDRFGDSVSISGDTAIVAAPGKNGNTGVTYVFVRSHTPNDSSSWPQQAILTEEGSTVASDFFGFSVAIDGNTAVVGACGNACGGNTNQGSAYVFFRSGTAWSRQARLLATNPATGDGFGRSVAISGDTAIISAQGDRVTATQKGSAYVFVRSGIVWPTTPQQKLLGDDGGSFFAFGTSVSISGETAIVGSNDSVNAGSTSQAAYVFVRSGGAWARQAKLLSGDPASGDFFGNSVAISGDTAIVSADHAKLGGTQAKGAVYIFLRNAGTWAAQDTLVASDANATDTFGSSVAISGETTIVGSNAHQVGTNSSQGEAYVFLRSPDTDGDGIPDDWEKNGVVINGAFIDLKAMGADPMHKDVFVHADWMGADPARSGVVFKPDPRAIKMVIDGFAVAPANQVNNPDHKPGINLHVDLGADSIMKPGGAKWGALSRAGVVPFQAILGTFDDAPKNDIYNWTAVDAVKQAHFVFSNRSPIFHYVLFANNFSGSARNGGISRGIPGADFMVTLGDWPTPGGDLLEQAGTFMHELGHNLGLRHGGDDYINNKPNYLSIMNYAFQLEGLLSANGKRNFDYSRTKLDPLDELALNENIGINDPALHFTLWSRYTRPNSPLGSNKCLANDNYYLLFSPSRALDWNCDGERALVPYPSPNPNPDINDDGTCVKAGGTSLNSTVLGDDELRPISNNSTFLDRIVAGPDHICQSVAGAGDKQVIPVNGREPNVLNSFQDWPALRFTGSGNIGNAFGVGQPDQTSTTNDEPTLQEILNFAPATLLNEQLIAPLDVVTLSTQTGPAPLLVNFDGSASTAVNGTIVDWSWDFGDGTTGSGATISHTYTTPGDYYASLNVTDNNGHVNLVPLLNLVTVTDAPSPTPTPTPSPTPSPIPTPTPTPSPTPTPDPTPTPIPTPTPVLGVGDADPAFAATATRYGGTLKSIVTQPDGKIVVGGLFTSFAGCARLGVARITPDGRCDQSFDPWLVLPRALGSIGVDGAEVRALALQPDGKILVGITYVGDPLTGRQSPKIIVRLNGDGTLDRSFDVSSLTTIIPGVSAIALQPDGKIIVGGAFLYPGNNSEQGVSIARLNPDGSLDSSFNLPSGGLGFAGPLANGGTVGGSISALGLQTDGKIIIGGFFTRFGTVDVTNVARLNSDGSLDTGYATTWSTLTTTVNGIAFQPDGKAILAGLLPRTDGTATPIFRLNTDGSRDVFANGLGPSTGTGLALQPDGKLLVVGDFETTNPLVRNRVARLNADGTLDTSFDTGSGTLAPANDQLRNQKTVSAVALETNGKAIIGGNFDHFNGQLAESIMQINADGSRDQSFDSNGPGFNNQVQTLVRQPDGKLLVGFLTIGGGEAGGAPRSKLNSKRYGGIGRLNADGSTDFSFTSPFDESAVFGIALQADGKIIVSGSFRLIGSQTEIIFARLNVDGTLDSSFVPPTGVGMIGGGVVLAVQADGKILTTQRFFGAGSLVRLNTNGTLDSTFNAVFGNNSGAGPIALQPDGRIIVSGVISAVNGVARNGNMVRLNSDGSVDPSFDPGTGPDDLVWALLLQPDGKIIISGKFFNYNGTARNRIARVNADGSLDPNFVPFNPNTAYSREIRAVALQPDGKVVAGGFNQGNNLQLPPNRIFRLNLDGSQDASFPLTGSGLEGIFNNVNAILIQPDTSILIGGEFNVVNGAARLGLARILGATPSTPTPSPTPTATPTPAISSLQFDATTYSVAEGAGFATITVTRAGDTSGWAAVDFATSDLVAQQRTDYTIGAGTLTFAAGETSKTFTVLIVDDVYVEGSETLNLTLSNPTGGAVLGSPATATITITDNDSTAPTINPLDDAHFFVQQHYYDFLSRYPDQGGWDFWTGQISQCGTDVTCIRSKRIDVSNAFFYELEFQQTGAYVFRLYRAAFGNSQPFPNPDNSNLTEARKLPSYAVFAPDRARVVGGTSLAAGQLNLANAFVARSEFLTRYPASQDGPTFVDALLAAIRNDSGVDLTSQRAALISLYNAGGRGAVLYRLADDDSSGNPIHNSTFIDEEYNRAFVFTQYAGYLRRDADLSGFLFWLQQVNSGPLRDVAKQHAMVCSFITADEYQRRLSTVITHSNGECPQ